MKIDILIPTYNRLEKLQKAIYAIGEAKQLVDYYIYCYVYSSNKKDYEESTETFKNLPWVLTRLLTIKYKAPNFWNNHLKDSNADATYYLNDDVILYPACILTSITRLKYHYPDFDGVIGLKQENIPETQVCKAAFGLIGSKFADRFPERKVFCEDYYCMYLDKELELFSTKINRFTYAEEAKLIHLHPGFSEFEADKTHFHNRKFLVKDINMFKKRQEKKLLWGENFELLTRKS
jgi:hypothetical protein